MFAKHCLIIVCYTFDQKKQTGVSAEYKACITSLQTQLDAYEKKQMNKTIKRL